jgi:hypothetical protein
MSTANPLKITSKNMRSIEDWIATVFRSRSNRFLLERVPANRQGSWIGSIQKGSP